MLAPDKVLAKYESEHGSEITLTAQVVRDVISTQPTVTDKEIMLFVAMCKAYKLDPFIREAHLIKYGNQNATMVVGKDVFVKRAQRNPKFDGFEAGVTVIRKDGEIERRQGSLVGKTTERLIGAWARVYVKDCRVPFYEEVSFDEYAGRKKDGSLNQQWSSKPATMIRKVALVHALREAFPTDFTGLYDSSEMGIEEPSEAPIQMPRDPMPEPEYEVPDDYGPEGWSDKTDEEKAEFVEQVASRGRIMPDMDYDMAQAGIETPSDAGWEEF